MAQLEGRGIAYQGNRVGKLSLQGELLAAQQAQFSLDAERIWSGETEFGVLHLDGQGSLAAHSGALSLKGPFVGH